MNTRKIYMESLFKLNMMENTLRNSFDFFLDDLKVANSVNTILNEVVEMQDYLEKEIREKHPAKVFNIADYLSTESFNDPA